MPDLDLTFTTDSLRLEGSLRLAGDAPSPAALIISGSGPLDRNSDAKRMPVGVAAALADHLASSGVSSLRYDKRGIGASEGEYLATGFHDNVADARAALAALRARPEVDAQHVVVIGHSEGALIAAELASDADLLGVVLLAGSAQTGRRLLEWQAAQLAPSLPRPVRALMRLLRQDLVRTQSKRLDRLAGSEDDVLRLQGVKVNARWFREFMAHDPATSLRAAAVPVLAITGGKDVQVDPADVGRMGELVSEPFDGHVVEGVSHLLRHDPTDKGVRAYKAQMRQPVDAGLLGLVSTWVGERLGSPQRTQDT